MDEETLKKELFQITYEEKITAMSKDLEKLELLRAKHKAIHGKLMKLQMQKVMTANLKERGR